MVPLKQLLDAHFTPVFANPKGNEPPIEKHSDSAASFGGDEKRYQQMKTILRNLSGFHHPLLLSDVAHQNLDQYKGLFVPGGHAPMEDLWRDENLGAILRAFHATHRPTGLICHGPIALLSALANPVDWIGSVIGGKPMATDWAYQGYRMTVFSTAEEKSAEAGFLGGKVRFYPEDTMTVAGGRLDVAAAGSSHVVRDRELITGQNPHSDEAFGKALIQALSE
jgi:putative intracellular protease/amidase